MIHSPQSIHNDPLKPRIHSRHLTAENTLRTAYCKENEMQATRRPSPYSSRLPLHSHPSLCIPALCSRHASLLFVSQICWALFCLNLSAWTTLLSDPQTAPDSHLKSVQIQDHRMPSLTILHQLHLAKARALFNKWMNRFGGNSGFIAH